MNPIFTDEPAEQAPEGPANVIEHFEQTPAHSRRAARTSRKVRRRRRSLIFILIVAAFVVAGYFAVQVISPMLNFNTTKDFPGPGQGEVNYTLPNGASARIVAADLVKQNVVASEGAFVDALNAANGASLLLPGVYPLKQEMKAADVVTVLLAASKQKVHYAPIQQNLRQSEVFAALATATGLPLSDFTTLAKTPTALGLPAKAPSLEGYLSPGQYQFAVDMTAKQVLTEMIQKTKDELTQAGVTDPRNNFGC